MVLTVMLVFFFRNIGCWLTLEWYARVGEKTGGWVTPFLPPPPFKKR